MPLPMVHLGTAHGMIEEGLLHVRDFPAFYLGSIAPDGVHMRKDPGPEAKVASHLGTRHTSDLTPVAMFLQRHTGRENADFFLGYVVHVLTDAYWNELVYGPYTARYGADPSPVQTVRQAYYSDTDQIDLLLYRELPWRERVWEYLRQARGQDVGEVLSGQEADLWKDRTLNWYAQQPEKHLPRFGVYVTRVTADGKTYGGLTNIGKKPTIQGENPVGVETYLYDFDGDLYGKEIRVELLDFIRPEMRFDSIGQLKAQLDHDIGKCREIFRDSWIVQEKGKADG